jgi:NAD(P)-dependent dehydrogenase (short-subunit alcohol dehydrogenase family)
MADGEKAMLGKVCLVTGASSGIGLETARGLAALGATVVLLVRSQERGAAAIEEIRRTVPDADLHLVLADLYSLDEIRRAAAEFRQRWDRLHVLVNNAGLIHGKRELTVDGFEKTFALNHLAYVLLTHELVDLLERSAPSRIICVASDAHRSGKLDFDDLQHEKSYGQYRAYSDSKLCNILFSRQLARKLAGSGVTANSMHPGVVATRFGQSGSRMFAAGIALGRIFFISPRTGADTVIWLASAPEVEGVTGKYFVKRKETAPRRVAQNDEVAERLWQVTNEMLGLSW